MISSEKKKKRIVIMLVIKAVLMRGLQSNLSVVGDLNYILTGQSPCEANKKMSY